MVFFSKVRTFTKRIFKNFCSDCNFSLYYAFLRVFEEIGRKTKISAISNKFSQKRQKYIFKYLRKDLKSILNDFKSQTFEGNKKSNSPVWVCWWSGEESAPVLVKQCIKSIRSNANGRNVILINKNNYNQYIDIPEHMLNKSEEGKMCFAHLCDYIRLCLLCKYGGLWLDATIFCTAPLKDEYFDMPFFTCKSPYDETCTYISKLRWTTFVLGCYQNNSLVLFLKTALEHYWENNKVAIDYLFFDYLFELAYSTNEYAKNLIDNVPVNNLHRDDLQAAMNKALPANSFNDIIKPDTTIYKLSWRETYSLKTDKGIESIYSYFLDL